METRKWRHLIMSKAMILQMKAEDHSWSVQCLLVSDKKVRKSEISI